MARRHPKKGSAAARAWYRKMVAARKAKGRRSNPPRQVKPTRMTAIQMLADLLEMGASKEAIARKSHGLTGMEIATAYQLAAQRMEKESPGARGVLSTVDALLGKRPKRNPLPVGSTVRVKASYGGKAINGLWTVRGRAGERVLVENKDGRVYSVRATQIVRANPMEKTYLGWLPTEMTKKQREAYGRERAAVARLASKLPRAQLLATIGSWIGPSPHSHTRSELETMAVNRHMEEYGIREMGEGSSEPIDNPAPTAHARKLYEDFHWGIPASRQRKVRPNKARVGYELGTLYSVVYDAKKGRAKKKELYEHEFGETGRKKPVLAADTRGKLHIVGGGYTIKPEGITG